MTPDATPADVRTHRPPRAGCVLGRSPLDPVVAAINEVEAAVAAGARFIDNEGYADYRAALAALRGTV